MYIIVCYELESKKKFPLPIHNLYFMLKLFNL